MNGIGLILLSCTLGPASVGAAYERADDAGLGTYVAYVKDEGAVYASHREFTWSDREEVLQRLLAAVGEQGRIRVWVEAHDMLDPAVVLSEAESRPMRDEGVRWLLEDWIAKGFDLAAVRSYEGSLSVDVDAEALIWLAEHDLVRMIHAKL